MTYYSEYVQQLQAQFKALADLDSVDWVRTEYEDILKEGGPHDCSELTSFLSAAFEKEPNTLQQNSELNDFYQKVWHDMAFRSVIALSEQDQTALLEQKVVSAIKSGVDIEEFIPSYLQAFPDDLEGAKEHFKHFATALAQNAETIGAAPIEIGGKKYFPQIRFWLQDYLIFPSATAKRGSIDRLNYVNRSINVRSLTQVQRQELLAVLKLYDDLMNPPQNLKERSEARLSAVPIPSVVVTESKAESVQMQPARPAPSINIDQRLEDLKHRVEEK